MNILLIDDQADTILFLIEHIKQIQGWQWKHVSSARLALEELNKHWDVVCIDLKLSPQNTAAPGAAFYEGIFVAETARRKSNSTVIIVYSEDIPATGSAGFGWYNECCAAGADTVTARSKLVHLGPEALKKDIDDAVEKRRKQQQLRRPLQVDSSIKTRAAVGSVGAHVLSEMLEQLLPGMDEDRVQILAGGFTGALVWLVESKSSRAGTLKNVLKISNATGSLQDELSRRPPPGSVFNINAVRPEGSRMAEVAQWNGILIPAVQDSKLLRDYLGQPFSQKARRALDQLVDNLLSAPANNSIEAKADDISYAFSLGVAAQIWDSIAEVTSWKSLLKRKDVNSAEAIKKVVMEVAEGKITFSRFKKLALLHGDFHCRNVFISDSGTSVLIDFGRSEVYPRMFDFAALDADLLFSALDSGAAKDLKFGSQIDEWVKQLTSHYPFNRRTRVEGRTRWNYLRNILHHHAMQVKDANETEYAEALAFHIARYLRFPTTTAPKKLFAIRALGILLKELRF